MSNSHTFGRNKTGTSNFSNPSLVSPHTPTLANPTRGFGLSTNNAIETATEESTNQEEAQTGNEESLLSEIVEKRSFGHDISRIALHRPQPKLTVGEPGDKYEQEADRVANQVMRMVVPRKLNAPTPHPVQNSLQRECATCQEEEEAQTQPSIQTATDSDLQAEDSIESQLNTSKGEGSPLSAEVRDFMEPRFGTDFSQVRVHTGNNAAQMNQDLRAQAFTHEKDIYFGAGKAPAKDELTAHELTHVVQQTSEVQPPHVNKKPNHTISSQAIPVLAGQTPTSQVLNHLQSLEKTSHHDSSLYRQEILQFQQKNSSEKITASQQQILEQHKPVNIQQRDSSPTLRRCGGGSSKPSVNAEKVEFTSSHPLTTHSGDPKINPIWKPGAVDHAAAYTKGTNPVVNARFVNVGSTLPGLDAGGDAGSDGGADASVPPSVSVRVKEKGTVLGTKIGITPSGNAIDITGLTLSGLTGSTEVRKSNYNLEWEGSIDGTTWTPMTTTGSHLLYWLHAAPLATPLYNFAVDKATGYASGATDIPAAIRSGLRGDVKYDPADPINPDPLTVYKDGVAICTDFGNLLTLLARSVGFNANAVMFWGGFESVGKNVWVVLGGPYGAINLVNTRSPNPAYNKPLAPISPNGWAFNYHVISRIEGTLHDAALDRTDIDAQAAHDGKVVHLVELGSTTLPKAKKGKAYSQTIPRKDHTVQVTTRDYGPQITKSVFATDIFVVPAGSTSPVNVPVQWSLSGGSLPPGLSLNSLTGLISGTATTKGIFTPNIQVQTPPAPGPTLTNTSSLNIEVDK
ncbi:MAG: DUF4157 domain-containing protein [Desmonostoc vinosum HA7617-LM4]|jgi:hypothetical protein|nr:DUF4157 domain-containing protein [Desmonostoc vinosum HA7617-LM4]